MAFVFTDPLIQRNFIHVIKTSQNKFIWAMKLGAFHYGKNGRRGEREPKFLAVNFSAPLNGTFLENPRKPCGEFRQSDSFPVKVHSNEKGKRDPLDLDEGQNCPWIIVG